MSDGTLMDTAGAIVPISPTISTGSAGSNKQSSTISTADDVWRELVSGKFECKKEPIITDEVQQMMTLEDFLATAQVDNVDEDDVKPFVGMNDLLGYDHSPQALDGYGVSSRRRRERARSVYEDDVADKRRRRMIKNREAAMRSRERKQAYQAELEALAVRLEEENQKLLKEKGERMRKRLEQLMEKVVPVVEKHRPPRVLRRVHSTLW